MSFIKQRADFNKALFFFEQSNEGVSVEDVNQLPSPYAFELWLKATDMGNTMAMHNLGCCYLKGIGAWQICEKAADCQHEWEEIGGHTYFTEDHLSAIYFTDNKCKLCGKKNSRTQRERLEKIRQRTPRKF